ncbi:MAG: molybdopterin-guanine dinucleotide biosynthesis protein B [Pseudomonadota bacterium]
MKRFGVVGWKNAGKTGLMERLVAEFTARGVRVSTLKHAHHAFDVDHEGKDSWRHRAAGAQEVLVAGGKRWTLMAELREAEEPPLETLISKMTPMDLLLIEGWKRETHPKIEAWRAETENTLIAPSDPSIRAVASDAPVETALPTFDLNDTAAIADFIAREIDL